MNEYDPQYKLSHLLTSRQLPTIYSFSQASNAFSGKPTCSLAMAQAALAVVRLAAGSKSEAASAKGDSCAGCGECGNGRRVAGFVILEH